MKDLMAPVLMLVGWFGIALATVVSLADMGGTLAEMDKAQQVRQASLQAPRVALTTPQVCAE